MMDFLRGGLIAATISLCGLGTCLSQDKTDYPASSALPYAQRPVEDDILYFVMPDRFANGDTSNDRGELSGDRSRHGFDPTDKAFYHGGDLRGLIDKLDYIAGLGATAIWFTPIYKNKPVQGSVSDMSAGYHGYWITDFTEVDPHFGSRALLAEFVEEAHRRNIKVIMDIITNHTADVIQYRQCHDPAYEGGDKIPAGQPCTYRSKADYPYSTVGDVAGEAINTGFLGDHVQTRENFEKLTRPDYAYTPFVPEAERTAKKPAWLNDVRYYHNRGDTSFKGENSLYGDFVGLDDLFTEHPKVVEGFVQIYKDWITDTKIDGYRIDTARHVNPEFWRVFSREILAHAEEQGIPHFYIFGEVYEFDPGMLAKFTREDQLPAVLDFAFQGAVRRVLAGGEAPAVLERLFRQDVVYEGGRAAAGKLPTFLGNHDLGRFGHFIVTDNPGISKDEALKRQRLAHALMIFARGVPVIYYGDEQGFVGDGNDQLARQDMFPSQVAIYNDDELLGTGKTTADENFDTDHPLYRAITDFAVLYHQHQALRRAPMRLRWADQDEPGLFAFSRVDEDGTEYLVALNTGTQSLNRAVQVSVEAQGWTSLLGTCPMESTAPGSLAVDVPALDIVICKSTPAP